ncbi:MAG: hypothetical protein NPIRA05_19060 [Nitrospirales bacterium]|nr:MAG: hypothetical protein NPIRA05_19060 [Nitrospirales bacterium]
MKRTRRHHSREFKQEAVALVVEHNDSRVAAGRSLCVSGALIGRWKDELEAHKTEAFPDKETTPPSNSHSKTARKRVR